MTILPSTDSNIETPPAEEIQTEDEVAILTWILNLPDFEEESELTDP